MEQVYLGDSVYAVFDGYAVTIETRNGTPSDPSNSIVLEPEVQAALFKFIQTVYKSI